MDGSKVRYGTVRNGMVQYGTVLMNAADVSMLTLAAAPAATLPVE